MSTDTKRTLLSIFTLLYAVTLSAAPRIVVSIRPIHSLVANLTEGVTSPVLLMKSATSPHHYAIRPSEMKLLVEADILFLVGEGLENNLARTAKTLPTRVKVIELLKTPGLVPIAYQESHDNEHTLYDPHIWLDPVRMIEIADVMAKQLSILDPSHQKTYQENAKKLKTKLQQLHKTLEKQMNAIRDKPFLTFHDSYAYFKARYRLVDGDFMVRHPEQPLAAQQLMRLQKRAEKGQFVCLFQEEEFPSKAMQVLNEHHIIRTGVLDPIGNRLSSGSELYFEMMTRLAQSLSACLH